MAGIFYIQERSAQFSVYLLLQLFSIFWCTFLFLFTGLFDQICLLILLFLLPLFPFFVSFPASGSATLSRIMIPRGGTASIIWFFRTSPVPSDGRSSTSGSAVLQITCHFAPSADGEARTYAVPSACCRGHKSSRHPSRPVSLRKRPSTGSRTAAGNFQIPVSRRFRRGRRHPGRPQDL